MIGPSIDGICLTKVVNPQDIHDVASLLAALEQRHGLAAGTVRILAAIESARGLVNAVAIVDAIDASWG